MMKKLYFTLSMGLFVSLHSQTVLPSGLSGLTTENYVYSRTYLDSTTTSSTGVQQIQNVTYYDGLGRPKQSVAVKATAKGNDLVTIVPYDGFGRQVKSYLPVSMVSKDGGIQALDTIGVVSYYTTSPNSTTKDFDLIDANPFSHKILESSPLDRIQQQIQPGAAWSTKPVAFGYETNIGNEVLKFGTIDLVPWKAGITNNMLSLTVGAEYYPANQLYKNKVTDEDGNISYEFKNGEGQTILVRKMEGTTEVDTYYVYNEYNLLAYVISPLASEAIKNNLSIDLSSGGNTLSHLCYQYKYDGRGRLAEKKLPGKGWEYMVYDQQDRLVLSQDANLRLTTNNFKAKGWLFSKYDVFGRVVYTGFFPNGANRAAMQNALNSMQQNPGNNEVRTTSPTVTLQGMSLYYNNQGFPTGNKTLLSVNYYDTYPVDTPYPENNKIQGTPILEDIFPAGVTQSTKSLPTASFVKNIEDDNWTKNYSFYDRKGRAIGGHSINHLGGDTRTESILDFTGVPKKVFTYHSRQSSRTPTVTIEETFTYDHHNRLLKHEHQVNNQLPEILAENTYNEIGQLKTKKVGNNIQEIDYAYNIRGWMTAMNNPANVITMGNDLFAFTLRYTDKIGLETPDVLNNPTLKVKGRYNGNIAEIDWNSVDEAGVPPSNSPYRYGYVYDGLNRLKAGFYQDPGNPGKGTNNEIIDEYDVNGNIIKLKRFAWRPKVSTPAKIDDLTYTYTGNKVTNIADTGNSSGYEGGNGLIQYDDNGNMYTMPDKGITNITYNYLNLPSQITQQNITQYLYRADGVKLKKAYTVNNATGSHIINSEYLDGFQYVTQNALAREALSETDDHTLSARTAGEEEAFVAIDNLIEVPGTPDMRAMVLSFFPTAEGFYDYMKKQYIYQYKDHLGNVRLSYSKNTTTNELDILDRNDFYPFGMNFLGYHSVFDAMGTPYNYKYNGKELQETGMYDYGARFYMPDIGRWGVVDPLAEIGRRWSPYTYALDNPIRFIDPDGRWPYPVTTRSFAPSKTFGGGFSGDSRGFSTSSSVSSRLSHSYVMNTDNHTYTNSSATSSPSYHPLLGSGQAKDDKGTITNASYTANKDGSTTTSWTSTMSGKNPLTPESITPSIDVTTNFSLTENKAAGTLGVNVTQTGDAFPSAETMIGDTAGNQLMIGVSPAVGNPFTSLPGDGGKPMMSNSFNVTMDENGVFTGVQQGDKSYSVGDWNKTMTSQPTVERVPIPEPGTTAFEMVR